MRRSNSINYQPSTYPVAKYPFPHYSKKYVRYHNMKMPQHQKNTTSTSTEIKKWSFEELQEGEAEAG